MDRENSMEAAKSRLMDAALPHVAFDGWSDATLRAAISDSATSAGLARAIFPRGGVDMALAFHQRGDAAMVERLAATDLSSLRYRDRIAAGVRLRLEAAADKEAVRRAAALFSLPGHAGDGARAIWGTADAIWTALGDSSRDLNWYSKRATLSAVYATTLLFWLGDASEGHAETWAFLDRRIDQVMQFEKLKAGFRENPLGKALLAGPLKLLDRIHAPEPAQDLPGRLH